MNANRVNRFEVPDASTCKALVRGIRKSGYSRKGVEGKDDCCREGGEKEEGQVDAGGLKIGSVRLAGE